MATTDQIVPTPTPTNCRKVLKNGTLKTYKGFLMACHNSGRHDNATYSGVHQELTQINLTRLATISSGLITSKPIFGDPRGRSHRKFENCEPETDPSLPAYWSRWRHLHGFYISGDDTKGRYCLIDMHVPPGGGPPPHRPRFLKNHSPSLQEQSKRLSAVENPLSRQVRR